MPHPAGFDGQPQVTAPILWQLSYPVLVVDASCRVLYANRAATELLAEASGLVLRGDRLDCSVYADRMRLHAALRACFDARGDTLTAHARSAVSFCLAASGTRAVLTATVARLDAAPDSAGSHTPSATVILNRSRSLHETHRTVLRELFDLTLSEAMVAEALWDGLTVTEIATARMTKPATVRSQIRALFAKTMVTRQQDLIRLLASLPQLAIGPSAPH